MNAIMNKTFKFTKNKKGLTLIELLAVIVILGVIAAIAVPSVGGIISNSKTDADAQTVELVESAAMLYLVQEDPGSSGSVATSLLVSSGYLKEVPASQVTTTQSFTSVSYTYSATIGYTITAVTKS
jgi:type IV pilus assembly protein PilA